MSNALKRLQILRRERRLEEADYRALLKRITGQDTARGLTDAQLLRVIDAIGGGGGRRPAEGSLPAKVRALVWDLYQLGGWEGHPTERAIAGFVRRQAGVDDLRWLTPERVSSVVEALRGRLARAGLNLPSRIQPDRAELLLLQAQARRLEALGATDADKARLEQLNAAIAGGTLGQTERRRVIADNGVHIRAIVASSASDG